MVGPSSDFSGSCEDNSLGPAVVGTAVPLEGNELTATSLEMMVRTRTCRGKYSQNGRKNQVWAGERDCSWNSGS